MTQAHRLPSNGKRPPPNDGARGVTNAADGPDPEKQAFLARLNELQVWLGRRHAMFPRPCADRQAVEDLTRFVNLIARAERTGHSNASSVWSRKTAPQTGLPGQAEWQG